MADWMWFVIALVGMFLAGACFKTWVDAKYKVERILDEELNNNDDQDDSPSS